MIKDSNSAKSCVFVIYLGTFKFRVVAAKFDKRISLLDNAF